MMHDSMMWGMGISGLFALVIAILVIAALIKYLFFPVTGCSWVPLASVVL